MKKSDLKEIIRQGIIQELTAYEIGEAKKEKDKEPPPADEEDVEITADKTDTVEEPTAETPPSSDFDKFIQTFFDTFNSLSDNKFSQTFFDTLEFLQNQSKTRLKDDKLTTQIGNLMTYFTRQHLVKPEKEESLMENYELRRMKRIAGIIK